MLKFIDRAYPQIVARDRETALAVFKPFGTSPTFLMVEGEPRSKHSRSRKSAAILRGYFANILPSPFIGNVAVACTFYRSTFHRIDADNLLKNVLDAATGILWKDDSQVTACIGIVKLDAVYPRTAIIVGPHNEPSLNRGSRDLSAVCLNCGKPFTWRTYPSSKQVGKFCSINCNNRFGRSDLRAAANCLGCGTPFMCRVSAQKFCADDCRLKALAESNRKHPKAICQRCGGSVSRPEYRRCRSCFRALRVELREMVEP